MGLHGGFGLLFHAQISFMSSELSLGLNLYEVLRQFRGLPSTVVRTLVKQAVVGIKELSHKNIVHCDLKPEKSFRQKMMSTRLSALEKDGECLRSGKQNQFDSSLEKNHVVSPGNVSKYCAETPETDPLTQSPLQRVLLQHSNPASSEWRKDQVD
jgi:hypothetical protein